MFELTSTDALHHSVRGLADAGQRERPRVRCSMPIFADLAAANAAAQEHASAEAPPPLQVVELSLGGVTEGNSVLVSLLLVWMRRARAAGVDIVFVDIPPLVSRR